jgi:hypothetical protein
VRKSKFTEDQSVVAMSASSYLYRSVARDATALKLRIKEITQTRVHYGSRRVHVMLRREGHQDNVKRVYRLYREEGLSLHVKRPRRNKAVKRRQPKQLASPSTTSGAWTSWLTRCTRAGAAHADGRRLLHARVPGDRRRAKPEGKRGAGNGHRGGDWEVTRAAATMVSIHRGDIHPCDACNFQVRRALSAKAARRRVGTRVGSLRSSGDEDESSASCPEAQLT